MLFLELLKYDEDDVYYQEVNHNQNEGAIDEEDRNTSNEERDDENTSTGGSETSTLTPTSTSAEESDWTIPTPNNSPTETITRTRQGAVNPRALSNALNDVIQGLQIFNRGHPTPPAAIEDQIRRSARARQATKLYQAQIPVRKKRK